ncbi:hypothetical protein [Umezakia ovalisporum]|jgi:hypothetical protein|uniref:hypothetical protein n=1 Tax=Umezakia ovalisporum TaxID=75695 RepID=UPI0024739CD8|nr:hypothetical protein [Umezakia ovalisporum]MDH6085369.1 hypothetical protein [Umezakia ovalisporum TAC611]
MTDNSIQGNGNWYYADGQWISDEGADLSVADASASGNPPNGYIPDHVATGNSIPEGSAGNPFGGGSPFMAGDGGNVSMTSEDGSTPITTLGIRTRGAWLLMIITPSVS